MTTTRRGRAPAPRPAKPRPVHYPISDGKPLSDSGLNVRVMEYAFATFDMAFADQPDVYVSMDNFVYYEQGNPKAVVAPDVFLVRGAAKTPPRDSWMVWVEGVPPTLVIEVISPSTKGRDALAKRAIYEQVGVTEYVLFDTHNRYIQPPLQLLRLTDGRYTEVAPDAEGWVLSEVLGMRLRFEHGDLRFYDAATGAQVLSPREAADLATARVQAETARAEAEAARAEAEAARATVAERRVADLEAELRRLREANT